MVDWPQFHFDFERTGYNPFEQYISPNPSSPTFVGRLRQVWADSSPKGPIFSGAILANPQLFYATADGTVHCNDVTTGSTCPSFAQPPVGPIPEDNVPAAQPDRGILYYVAHNGNTVYAVNATQGFSPSGIIWRQSGIATAPRTSPAVWNNQVFVASTDGNLYVLATDVNGGGSQNNQLLAVLPLGAASIAGPAIDSADNEVLVTTAAGQVLAFQATAPYTKLWTTSLPGGGAGFTPAVALADPGGSGSFGADGIAFVASTTGMAAFDAATGAELWARTDILPQGSPAIIGPQNSGHPYNPLHGAVYVNDSNGIISGTTGSVLRALDPLTGNNLPGFSPFATLRPTHSSPATANGLVFLGSQDGHLYIQSATTGALLKAIPAHAIESSPVVTNGHLYFGDNSGIMYAYSF